MKLLQSDMRHRISNGHNCQTCRLPILTNSFKNVKLSTVENRRSKESLLAHRASPTRLLRGIAVGCTGERRMTTLPQLRPPSRARLVDDVCQSLEEAILSGRIAPGERLREAWIAEQLGVSRTTIREALLMLERQGLVVTKP